MWIDAVGWIWNALIGFYFKCQVPSLWVIYKGSGVFRDGVPSKLFEGYISDSNLQSLFLDLYRVRSPYHLHGYHKPLYAFP